MLSFGIITEALVLVVSIVFSKSIVARLPADIAEFRTGDRENRIAIAIWWGIGMVLVVFVARTIWGLAVGLASVAAVS